MSCGVALRPCGPEQAGSDNGIMWKGKRMDTYLYLSMSPESLIVSMLPPEEFGIYLATGTQKRPHGPAMFFQLKREFESDYFDFSNIEQQCVPHPDGQPKHSLYLAIYRVLEHAPLDAMGNLYLTTAHGRILELKQGEVRTKPSKRRHLYQELCPVHPLITSSLAPDQFRKFITDTSKPISVPKICFVELELGDLAQDPAGGSGAGLPYHNIDHIRECLAELNPDTKKQTKTVDRISRQWILYRCIESGFYVGDQEQMLYYPYPSREELESKYYSWWRCANDAEIDYL